MTITSVTDTAYPSSTPGQIYVSVTSTTALGTLVVDVMTGAGATELALPMSDFTLETGGTDTNGTYELTNPITTGTLAPGSYTLDVTAADAVTSSTNNGTAFPWLMQPTVTIAASQTTFSYNNPAITFSGTLSLVNPDGSAPQSAQLDNVPLLLNGGTESTALTTGTGGAYSITVSEPQNDTAYDVSVDTSSIAYGNSAYVDVSAATDPVEATANVSATQLNRGQQVTVSGTVDYNPGSGYVPLPDSTVEIYDYYYLDETGPTATVTTNSAGQYTATFADYATGSFYVYTGGVPYGGFLDEVLEQALTISKNVNVAQPVTISGLRGSLSPFGILTLTGCLGSEGSAFPPALSLRAQYATKTSGPWHTLRTVHGLSGTSCGSGSSLGQTFSYQVPVAVASAYYRLSYAGSSDYEPAVSGVLHEAKILTRITNFHVSSRSVRKDGYITVSGRLWKDVKGWHPLARQRVWVLFVYKGGLYYDGSRPLTNSSGRFSGRYQVPFSAPWFAEFRGSSAYFASATAEVTVKATSASSAGSIPHLAVAPLPR